MVRAAFVLIGSMVDIDAVLVYCREELKAFNVSLKLQKTSIVDSPWKLVIYKGKTLDDTIAILRYERDGSINVLLNILTHRVIMPVRIATLRLSDRDFGSQLRKLLVRFV